MAYLITNFFLSFFGNERLRVSDLQGLENLSSDTLSKGREFVLEHLMNNSALKDKQLQAVLVAAMESGERIADVIDGKLCERQAVVSCVSALETGLKILSRNLVEVEELIQREDKDATFVRYVTVLIIYSDNVCVAVDDFDAIFFS